MLDWLQNLLLSLLNRLAADTASRVGGGLGVLAWRLGIRRRVANANLTRCLGLTGAARARVMRRSYATMGASFLEVWTIGGPAGPEHAMRVLNPRWRDLILRRSGTGVFITPHLGCWDMGAYAMVQAAGGMTVYAKAQHNAGLDARLNQQRARAGMQIVLLKPGDRSGAVQAMRILRQGGILGMLADQKPSGGAPGTFLGVPTRCHEGPAFFARKASAPVIPGVAIRVRAGVTWTLVGRPVRLSGDHGADVQVVMDLMSAMIAAFPGQYFWQHRRFSEAQPGAATHPAGPWREQRLALIVRRRG